MDLSTATNYAKLPDEDRAGFKCTILGFGSPGNGDTSSLLPLQAASEKDCVGGLEDVCAHVAGEAPCLPNTNHLTIILMLTLTLIGRHLCGVSLNSQRIPIFN